MNSLHFLCRRASTCCRKQTVGITAPFLCNSRNPNTLFLGHSVATRVTVRGQPVQVTSTEFQLLAVLAQNAGRIIESDVLLQRV